MWSCALSENRDGGCFAGGSIALSALSISDCTQERAKKAAFTTHTHTHTPFWMIRGPFPILLQGILDLAWEKIIARSWDVVWHVLEASCSLAPECILHKRMWKRKRWGTYEGTGDDKGPQQWTRVINSMRSDHGQSHLRSHCIILRPIVFNHLAPPRWAPATALSGPGSPGGGCEPGGGHATHFYLLSCPHEPQSCL